MLCTWSAYVRRGIEILFLDEIDAPVVGGGPTDHKCCTVCKFISGVRLVLVCTPRTSGSESSAARRPCHHSRIPLRGVSLHFTQGALCDTLKGRLPSSFHPPQNTMYTPISTGDGGRKDVTRALPDAER